MKNLSQSAFIYGLVTQLCGAIIFAAGCIADGPGRSGGAGLAVGSVFLLAGFATCAVYWLTSSAKK